MKAVREEIEDAIDNGEMVQALKLFDKLSLENNGDLLFLRGVTYYKLQRWGDALNDFSNTLRLQPSNKKAQTYIDMINGILGFYHKDGINP